MGVVAAVAIAIAAPYLAPLALGALGITATATAVAIATAVITLGLSLAVSLAFSALGVGAPSAKNAVGPPQVFRQSITNSFIVYGRRRVGGLLVFFHARQSGDDHFRYFVIACAGHQCSALVDFMLNDEVVTVDGSNMVTSGKYASAAWLWFVRGTATDAANATFVSECDGMWTSAHQGKGVAKIYAKFQLTDDVVQAGMPNITAIIDGRDEILDTRDASTGFTANGALVFYDWMKMPREEGGFGAYDDEIPDDAWISAQANVCDEAVSSEARYELHGVITTGATPSEVRDAMIVNMAGTYAYSAGVHLMRPGYWVPSTATLSEDDLAGPIQVSPFMAADATANQVQGTYISPSDGYQGMPFPTQSIDADDIRQTDLDLAFTTSSYQGQRVAQIMLRRAAAEKSVVWSMNIMGLKQAALDTVQLDSDRYGLSNYAFQVANWSLSTDWGVVLSLREENEEIYEDPTPVVPPTPPTITQPDPIPPTSDTAAILRASYPKDMRIKATDAGTSVTATYHGSASDTATFIIDYATNPPQDITVPHGTITGLLYSADVDHPKVYYAYCDVDAPLDATPTYGATTVFGDALNSATHPNRIYLNQSFIAPVAGGTDTSGGATGGGYGGTTGGGAQGGEIP